MVGCKGFSIEVDDEDVERVHAHSWYLNGKHNVQNQWKVTIGRFILKYNGPLEVDHKDRNIFNNKKDNLRLATRQQQLANRGPIGKNKYKGVSYDAKWDRYRVHICENYKVKHIGSFRSVREAALAYNRAAVEIWGEFAYLNQVETQETCKKDMVILEAEIALDSIGRTSSAKLPSPQSSGKTPWMRKGYRSLK